MRANSIWAAVFTLVLGFSPGQLSAVTLNSCFKKVAELIKGAGSIWLNAQNHMPVDPSLSSPMVDIRLRAIDPSLAAEIARGRQIVQSGNFTQERDLPLYRNILGPDFEESLDILRNHGGHWIDMGAGRSAALRGFLVDSGNNIRGTAVVKADSDVRNTRRLLRKLNRPEAENRFRHFTGGYIEDYSAQRLAELGQAELITDVYGPMTYSHRPDLVLETYFKLIPVGGSIFITRMQTTEFESEYGISRDLRRWLDEGHGYDTKLVGTHGVLIKKTSGRYFIPPLKVKHFEAFTPPTRVLTVEGLRTKRSNRESLSDPVPLRSLHPSEPAEADSQDRH